MDRIAYERPELSANGYTQGQMKNALDKGHFMFECKIFVLLCIISACSCREWI